MAAEREAQAARAEAEQAARDREAQIAAAAQIQQLNVPALVPVPMNILVWDHTYGGAERDGAFSIVALADGGLAVAGLTESKGAGDADMWVLRLDEAGNVLWDHTYGGAVWDQAYSIVALADGGFAVAGYTGSKGAGEYDMWVLRLAGAPEQAIVGAR